MVLNRVASNFVQLRSRAIRNGSMNENEDSSAKLGTRDMKSATTRSATTESTRERRARLSGGLKGKQQRVRESKRRHNYTSRLHTLLTRTSSEATAGSASTSLSQSNNGQQRNEAHADVEMAPADTRAHEPKPPSFIALQFKPRLNKPVFNEVSEAQLGPNLEGVPAAYVRDILEIEGQEHRTALAKSNIIGFYGQDKKDPRLPEKVIVEHPESITRPPSHALALHSDPVPPNTTRNVSVQLGHSLVLAAHCSNLRPLPPTSEVDDSVVHEDARGRFVRYKVDIVPLRVPSVELFPILVSYLCTLDEQWLLNLLLGIPAPPSHPPEPVQLPTPVASPPHLNKIADSEKISYLTQEIRTASVQLAILHANDWRVIMVKAHKVWNLYRNAIALGVNETGLWSTMQTAWSILLLAMDIVSKSGRTQATAN
ncbi:hypothetical protein SCHPADRAFT_944943 [Schizopora paradoxa]|uniref:Uncharacterized protein n=1 Tax=Schizopora paradoxa TaxID=27342 RepID=A0A0H2RE68_9AGAM|nr:hypothetical protein SCHPADRAFT_944943 [Schizopora paradoxa]